jgi:two-component system CitB family response regulator
MTVQHLTKVLIVEDDLKIAEIHRRFTEKISGFEVIGTATTGEQAQIWLEVMEPDLILLDVYLPDMRGIDLVHWIRQRLQATDIIMITASSEVDVVRTALHGGVFDYIVKPLTYDRFKESLDSYKSRTQQLKQNDSLSSEQIAHLWKGKTASEAEERATSGSSMPKGIDPLTLDKVVDYIHRIEKDGATAESVSREIGVSRSTARRYLEYLISKKRVYAELIYGNVGRPERRYFRKSSP